MSGCGHERIYLQTDRHDPVGRVDRRVLPSTSSTQTVVPAATSQPPVNGSTSEQNKTGHARLKTSPGSDESPAIDWDAAAARYEGCPSALDELANLFADECSHMMADVEHSVAAGDSQAVLKAAHTLKGSADAIAATRVVQSAASLEAMGKNQDLSAAQAALRRLRADVDEVCRLIETRREAGATASVK